ncbi:hypothetical protein [Cellulomonas fimi]|uniref:YcxB-like protein domain-containing protein n=1 Tax=Cellulomonas fimi (strain ATCC 484 / DSM 20113 / JCM 1341 / CCUG 24087 / LMG 16345 / NBRC 15513 / NCIMB 8980 / NCTC 7547 / NRS-133) TaxID=590998 RepID=F4H2D1_CELFA|nr:hypothetical protein [Cellulomonas fimi]AEE47551.1 hypothetical protein Celf_3439 [Cellulomonas fimi ATCC 484]NNH07940.1 hypothetical protein [Cellulomonas fimi]VEH36518.1 Uncharacterised protein [Cellulomonas fimi]
MHPLLPPPDDPAISVREWTADAGYPARVVSVLSRRVLWTRRGRALLLGVALVLGGCALVLDPGPLTVLLWLLPIAVAVPVGRVRMRRQVARQLPVGTTVRAALTPDGVWMQGPLGAAVTSYGAYRDVVPCSDVLVLVQRHSGRQVAVPAALFPGPDLDLLRARVAAAAVSG